MKKRRRGINVEAPTATLYRYFVAHATPYVATRSDDGTFTVLNEERWKTLLSACEAKEAL